MFFLSRSAFIFWRLSSDNWVALLLVDADALAVEGVDPGAAMPW